MSSREDRHSSNKKKNTKSRQLNHYQRKVTDRQHLEAVYRNKVRESDSCDLLQSIDRNKPIQVRQEQLQLQQQQPLIESLYNEEEAILSYLSKETQQPQQQQQQPLEPFVVYVSKEDQNHSLEYLQHGESQPHDVPIAQGVQFDLNQLVLENQDSGFNSSLKTVYQQQQPQTGLLFSSDTENSHINLSDNNNYSFVIRGPTDHLLVSTSNTMLKGGRGGEEAGGGGGGAGTVRSTTPNTMMYISQQQQQPFGYNTSPHTPPKQYISPVRDHLALERGFMSPPLTPRSLESPLTPVSSTVQTTTMVTAEPRACSPYVPTAAGSSTTMTTYPSYVPTPATAAATTGVGTTAAAAATTVTARPLTNKDTTATHPSVAAGSSSGGNGYGGGSSSKKIASSVGKKKISFKDCATRRTDLEADDSDDNEEELPRLRLFEIRNETSALDRDYVIEEIKTFIDNYYNNYTVQRDDNSDDGDNLFSTDERKIRLLLLVGRYSDKRNGNRRFENGFNRLFANGVPDNMESEWIDMIHRKHFLYVIKDKVPRSVHWLFVQLAMCYSRCSIGIRDDFLVPASGQIKRMKGKSPTAVLQMASSINASLEKHLKRKRTFGDEIDESDLLEPPSPSPSLPPQLTLLTPQQQQQLQQQQQHQHQQQQQQPRKRRRTTQYEDDDAESDVGSIVSTASTTTRQRRTAVTAAATRRGVVNNSNFVPPENEAVLLPPPPTPHPLYSGVVDGIMYRPSNQPVRQQGIVCTAVPNVHLCKATKNVVMRTIVSNDRNIEFSDLIEMYVSEITETIFTRPVTNMADICLKIRDVTEERDKSALTFCTNLRSLVLTEAQITFEAVMNWCRVYCTTLTQVLCRVSERIEVGCDVDVLRTQLREEYNYILTAIKDEMANSIREYNQDFDALARISDWCLYTVFGVSLRQGGGVDMSVMVKNILSCWITLKKPPIHLTKEETARPDKVLWCIPLAHLTQLGGFGKPLEATRRPTTCGLDEYLNV